MSCEYAPSCQAGKYGKDKICSKSFRTCPLYILREIEGKERLEEARREEEEYLERLLERETLQTGVVFIIDQITERRPAKRA